LHNFRRYWLLCGPISGPRYLSGTMGVRVLRCVSGVQCHVLHAMGVKLSADLLPHACYGAGVRRHSQTSRNRFLLTSAHAKEGRRPGFITAVVFPAKLEREPPLGISFLQQEPCRACLLQPACVLTGH